MSLARRGFSLRRRDKIRPKVDGVYHLSRRLYLRGVPLLPRLLKFYIRIIFSGDLPCEADIHPSVTFEHNALGVVISARSTIGAHSVIYHEVTLGVNGKGGAEDGYPVVGEHVRIYAGAKVLGPVHIGDYAQIGANAVVLHDVPAHAVAVGIPARVLRPKPEAGRPDPPAGDGDA